MVKLGQTPINQAELDHVSWRISNRTAGETYLSVLMIDHNVMRFHISVHDALAVTEIKCLEEFEDVVSNIEIVEFGVEAAKVGVVDVFEDQRRCLALHGIRVRNGSQSQVQEETLLSEYEELHSRREQPEEGLITCESRTTSSSATMFGPPARFWRILISRLIFFFLTGFNTLMTHFW